MDFNDMMQKAVKLKGAQMQKYRKKFESWPEFFKNTLFWADDVTKLRELPFDERLAAAMNFKLAGGKKFAEGKHKEASDAYQKSLGTFKFVRPTVEDWKKKGLADDTLEAVDYLDGAEAKADESKAKIVREHQVVCYVNIAVCELKLKNWELCKRACDEALEIDPGNIKALYRRAKARILAPTSGGTELELALKDLERGYAEARRRGEKKLERVVGRELKGLRADLVKQRKVDKKTFAGLFDRGSLYEKEISGVGDTVNDGDGGIGKKKLEVEKDLRVAKQLVQKYRAEGDDKEADKLQLKIDMFEREVQKRREKAMREQFDFENPTEEMIKEAKAKGIDLTDEVVVGYLQALRDEKMREFRGETEEADESQQNISAAAQRLQREYSARERRERYGEAGREERQRNTGFFGYNRLVLGLTALFLFYRLYSMGMFGRLYAIITGPQGVENLPTFDVGGGGADFEVPRLTQDSLDFEDDEF